ncbi:MAG: hypothetical protein JWQ21_2399 [Herminiimonas sp.]|nr:hypothetical protein [Herminiimonas sp.]
MNILISAIDVALITIGFGIVLYFVPGQSDPPAKAPHASVTGFGPEIATRSPIQKMPAPMKKARSEIRKALHS